MFSIATNQLKSNFLTKRDLVWPRDDTDRNCRFFIERRLNLTKENHDVPLGHGRAQDTILGTERTSKRKIDDSKSYANHGKWRRIHQSVRAKHENYKIDHPIIILADGATRSEGDGVRPQRLHHP